MTSQSRPASTEAGLTFYSFAILGAMLIFAPLIKGGNRPLPLMILEISSVALLFSLLVRLEFNKHLSKAFLSALAALVALPLIQLLPLPDSVWSLLPGRDLYAEAASSVGASVRGAVSLIPTATNAAFLVLLIPLAVFLATVSTSAVQLKHLVNLFIALATLQAVIGLAQYGTGSLTVFWPQEGGRISSALGTYPNYNHFAGFLEMALPLALALLVANVDFGSRKAQQSSRRDSLRQRLRKIFSGGLRVNAVAFYSAAALAILLGIVFSRSRTGIALAMLGILLCALIFGAHMGGATRSKRLITLFGVIGFALALEIGLLPVLARFSDGGVVDHVRLSIFSGTIQGIWEFFPFGSGLGTYPAVFRRFQPDDVPLFVNHAHNDYLEWLFEGGLASAILMLAFATFYLLRWREIWPTGNNRWTRITFLRAAAGISLLLMGMHGLIDFNLHIPANAAFFAFVAGVFFHAGETERLPDESRKSEVTKPVTESKPQPPVPWREPVPEVPNPFADLSPNQE